MNLHMKTSFEGVLVLDLPMHAFGKQVFALKFNSGNVGIIFNSSQHFPDLMILLS